MAVIKCPECGHQVSEKAPSCPGCGVLIAGKILRCPNCGEVYFNDQVMCPGCHRPTNASQVVTPVQKENENIVNKEDIPVKEPETPKKKSYTALIVSFVFALIVCGVCYYFYNDAKSQKEHEDYEYAMSSTDLMVLQTYLNVHKDAQPAHRDSVQARMLMLKQIDEDWTNAVVSGTREAIEAYLKNHPDSPHKASALNKIDSMDFLVAQKTNSLESYSAYLEQHPDGKYSDQAKNEVEAIKAKIVSPEEEQMVKGLFKRFFQSVNSRNEDGMLATVADQLESFLGRSPASKSDVVQFMHKIYKADIINMNWHIIDDYKIEKRPIGQSEFEYTVKFTAEQNIDRIDFTQPRYNKYSISAMVNIEGKISEFNMSKLTE